MSLCSNEDGANSIVTALGSSPGPVCRLAGRVEGQDDGKLHFYPTADDGVWLEIDSQHIVERIESGDASMPTIILVAECAPMTLRMDVTASDVRTLLAAAGVEPTSRAWPDWRTATRARAAVSGSSRGALSRRKPSLPTS